MRPPSGPAKTAVAVALTFVAGYVDAIGWLKLDQVFIAQMSGNIMLLAVHLVAGEAGHVSLQADAIVSFFLGLVISGGVIEIGMRQRLRRIFVAAVAVEVAMLLAFTIMASAALPAANGGNNAVAATTYGLVAIVAFAMGTQNTSLRMAGILSVWTTHMTGAVSGLSEELIVCLFGLFQGRRARRANGGFVADRLRETHPTAFKNIGRSAALIAAFFIGAVAGALMLQGTGIGTAMTVPLALLLAIGVLDWAMPLTQFPSSVEQE
jgi:uncharacterized membrane protein YoaK (UPF0700 family)